MKGASTSAPAAIANGGGGGSLHAVADKLRLRRKRPTEDASAASTAPMAAGHRRIWKNPFSPTKRRYTKGSEADDSESDSRAASPSLRPALMRAVSAMPGMSPGPSPQLYFPPPENGNGSLGPPPPARPPAMHRDMSTPAATTLLDSVSLESPPHVAVRYGDTIRLFARSKYVPAAESGGYVGTFEAGRRFLAGKTNPPKTGELACLPPVVAATATATAPTTTATTAASGGGGHRASSFTIVSTCGREPGAPVSYGDVVVLVDDSGRVWNNKIGAGPTTRNGFFGPRDHNLPGEMYLSFYQLDGGEELPPCSSTRTRESDSDSDGDGDGDSFLSLSALARSTKSMAETTFGKPTAAEVDAAAAALRCMGRVMYYGDRHVIIDVADSNRLRSKFNRVVTHFRKPDDPAGAVRGGYLRCDGKGKPITFELHGPPLASVQRIDVRNRIREGHQSGGQHRQHHQHHEHDDEKEDSEGEGAHKDRDGTTPRGAALQRVASSSSSSSSSSGGSIAVGRPLEIRDAQPASVVSLLFSDGGVLKIPCTRFMEADEQPFFRIVLGGARALRIQLLAVRSARSRSAVSIKKTLVDTYRELAKLYGGVVVVSSAAAFVLSKLLRLTISLPAMYLGGVTVLGVFLLELFYPGRVFKSHDPSGDVLRVDAEGSSAGDSLGDWKLSIVSIEASPTERIECAADRAALSSRSPAGAPSSRAAQLPKSFLLAENGNRAKAVERYEATLAWRHETGADTILTLPHLQYAAIKQNYHQFLHKTDKLGHPVYIEKIGTINMKELQRLGISQDDLFQHYLFTMEFTLQYAANQRCPCDACAPSETQKLFLILDARGLGMRDLSGDGAEFIRKCTSVMQRHYPQRSFKIFLVNVPSWFGMAWKGIKPLLNETTRAKTSIVSESDTPAALLEHIGAENLPAEYGGTCVCPGGCEANSALQRLQKKLVESVISRQPFSPDELVDAAPERPSCEGVDSEAECARARESGSSNGLTELSSTLNGAAYGGEQASIVPPGLFRDEVLRAGYLLKRPMKHNNFTPIWNRRFFILHPDSLRFGKAPRSEIYQIVPLTATTSVRRSLKGTNTFELVTPLMATNGHSLVLYAPTLAAANQWVEAIQQAVDKLAGKAPPSPPLGPSSLPPSAQATPSLSPAGSDVEAITTFQLPATVGFSLRGSMRVCPSGSVPNISSKHEPTAMSNQSQIDTTRAAATKARTFWQKFPEKQELNQYWYSAATVDALAREVLAQTCAGARCAFLSTPSVYYAVKAQLADAPRELFLLDFDAKFASEESRFVAFDFNRPDAIPSALHQSVEFVVIDPPFITKHVWEQYAQAASLLLRPCTGKILLSTIAENHELIQKLLGCSVQRFKPSIPHLVYQYALFANYVSALLGERNPELDAEAPET